MKHYLATFVFLFSLQTICSAEVYQWTDEKGQIHYSDHPRGSNAQIKNKPNKNKTKPNTHKYNNEKNKRDKLLQSYEEEREVERVKQQHTQRQKAKNSKKCQKVRNAIKIYETSGIMYDTDDKGNRRILSGAERDADVKKLKQQLAEHCQ